MTWSVYLIIRTDSNNFSPRLGCLSPSKEWVVRAGLGLYYDRLPLAFLNRAIQKNGVQTFEQVATDTEAANVFAAPEVVALNSGCGIAQSIFRADPQFVYTSQCAGECRSRASADPGYYAPCRLSLHAGRSASAHP